MAQISWPAVPTFRVMVNVPDPPPTDDVAIQDWMQKVKTAVEAVADERSEMQAFLEDMLTSVQSLQLFGNDIFLRGGTNTPEGAVTANIGSLFLRTDGAGSTTLYVKESGTGWTGWTAK